ncbi:MAG: hypothetical protein FWE14_10720 [Lachnospiraceae bacterium]|nr:hypothetical protein [Lachnospiraceae bacterium]
MLGKLIKYEFKAVWKFLAIAAVFMACLTLVGVIGIHIIYPVETVYFQYDFPGDSAASYTAANASVSIFEGLAAALYTMAYVAGAFLLTAGVGIYLWMRFHNSMYGHQGYLTNTLPTTPAKIIVSKLITAVICFGASVLLFISSIMVLVYAFNSANGLDTTNDLPSLAAKLREYGISVFGSYTLYTLIAISAVVFSILMMYVSSALGQLVKKNRGFAAIGFFFAITMIVNFVITFTLVISTWIFSRIDNGVLFRNSMNNNSGNMEYVFRIVNWGIFGYLALIILGSAILYYLTHYVTSKRLNLE